jgi:hypothetical protein
MLGVQNIIFVTHLCILQAVSFDQLIGIENNFYVALRSYWYQHNFLTLQWWILVIVSIFPAIIWWKLVNKKTVTEIIAFGLFYGVAAIIIDSIGSNMLLWTYPYKLTPYLYPQLYPYDVGALIVPFMLVYQKWSQNFKMYCLITGLLSAFLAFVAESLFEWLNIYKEIIWKHIYSFPIYWILGLICRQIIKYFKKIEQTS